MSDNQNGSGKERISLQVSQASSSYEVSAVLTRSSRPPIPAKTERKSLSDSTVLKTLSVQQSRRGENVVKQSESQKSSERRRRQPEPGTVNSTYAEEFRDATLEHSLWQERSRGNTNLELGRRIERELEHVPAGRIVRDPAPFGSGMIDEENFVPRFPEILCRGILLLQFLNVKS